MKARAGSAAAGHRPVARAAAKTATRAAAKSVSAASKKSAPARTAKAKPAATVSPTRRQDAPLPAQAKPVAKASAAKTSTPKSTTPRVVPSVDQTHEKRAETKPTEAAVTAKPNKSHPPKQAPGAAPATKAAASVPARPAPPAGPPAGQSDAQAAIATAPEPVALTPPAPAEAPAAELAAITPAAATAVAETHAEAPAAPSPAASIDSDAPPPRPAAPATPMNRAAPPPRPPAKPEVFAEGDHVVYPTHGVGKVERIAVEEIAGHKLELIHITFEENRMTLRVPVSKARSAGLRKLATRKLFEEALNVLKGRARIKRTMWSRRAQEYEAKINSGDPLAIAEVVRDLHRNAGQPDQSFSERQIYEAAMDRLAAELAALDNTDKLTAAGKLSDFLRTV